VRTADPPPPGSVFRVRVPATSANLGSGFDALGLALDLWDTYTVEVTAGPPPCAVAVHGEGAGSVSTDEANLVVSTMRAAAAAADAPLPTFSLRCDNVVPHGRGLGSSAAAIVGGVLAGRALAGLARDQGAELELAAALEGHPDNVAAALLGGLTVAWWDASGPARAVPTGRVSARAVPTGRVSARAVPSGRGSARAVPSGRGSARAVPSGRGSARAVAVRPVGLLVRVWVPPAAMSTTVARGLLAASVSHADAAHAAGRTALLVAALTGAALPGGHEAGAVLGDVGGPDRLRTGDGAGAPAAPDRSALLLAATEDRLHQDARGPAMPVSAVLLHQLRERGVAAVLSGSGPTVLALGTTPADRARWEAVDVPAGWSASDTVVAGGACVTAGVRA